MILKIVGIIVVVLLIGGFFIAKSKGVSPLSWKMHKPVSQSKQIAIQGFDPVSYFEKGLAEKGDPTHAHQWKDVTWYFTSTAHLEKFKANPEQSEPQYGGYCSFAVSKGFTATPDPTAWHIHEGKLYLFADTGMKEKWVGQLPEVLEACEKKWTY